ncbi:MAG: Fic family protein [Candidatus Nanopelagicales bacterium]
MVFDPDYGETLATDDERAALTSEARELLGDPVRKADLYDLEQQIQSQVADDLLRLVLDGTLSVTDLLNDHFVRELHRRMYAPVWTWGGRQRSRETNIGIAPGQISVAFRDALQDLRYRWETAHDLTARELGISAHAALVHVHPFVDGNGRTTRLLADLVFVSAQDEDVMLAYDWEFDRDSYIRRLREYDQTRDASALIDFVPVVEIGDEG